MSRRPRSMASDIDLIAYPNHYIRSNRLTYASGALQANIARYLLLKDGATSRLNRRLLIGHPRRVAWYHGRMRQGFL